jgi:NAD(P)-dependent dehydrogenase (short-subunit alcohol dehydrogenase family)
VDSIAGANMALEGKVVLITGAKGGLGTYVTQAFLDGGARVIGVSRSIQDSDFSSPCFSGMAAELSNGEAARALVDNVVAKYQRIDALVHLVGGFAGGKSIADTDDATLDKMLDLNLRSVFHIARAVVPVMRAQGSGRIVAIGSRTAVEPQPLLGVYSASKAALVSLIRTLAQENKDREISVNVILPGTMDVPANRTAMPGADFSKWVRPGQIAALALHLASDQGSQVTGAAIPVYGGEL